MTDASKPERCATCRSIMPNDIGPRCPYCFVLFTPSPAPKQEECKNPIAPEPSCASVNGDPCDCMMPTVRARVLLRRMERAEKIEADCDECWDEHAVRAEERERCATCGVRLPHARKECERYVLTGSADASQQVYAVGDYEGEPRPSPPAPEQPEGDRVEEMVERCAKIAEMFPYAATQHTDYQLQSAIAAAIRATLQRTDRWKG